ncbi:MAG: hypothetical protein ABW163_06145 [Luteimonas sp.]
MRIAIAMTTSLLIACAALPASAQQLRNPADPPPRAGQALRQVEPPPRIPTAMGTRSAADAAGNAARERCLQRATASIQPTSNARVASAQRRAAAVETQRAARGADATDPTDRSGLRAQRDAEQRTATRERNAASQRIAVAQANCR